MISQTVFSREIQFLENLLNDAVINALNLFEREEEQKKRKHSFREFVERHIAHFPTRCPSKSRTLCHNGDVSKQCDTRGEEYLSERENNVEREILFGDRENFLTFAEQKRKRQRKR